MVCGGYEVTVCLFRRDFCGLDDTLLAHTALPFTDVQAAVSFCEAVGIKFK